MTMRKKLVHWVGVVIASVSLSGLAADGPVVGPGPLWETGTINHIDAESGIIIIDDAPYRIPSDMVVFSGKTKSLGIDRLQTGMAVRFRQVPGTVSGVNLIGAVRVK